jgi:hypothetical protein
VIISILESNLKINFGTSQAMQLNRLHVAAIVFWSMTSAEGSCKLYPIHSLVKYPYAKTLLNRSDCRHQLTRLDQDQDGQPDWSESLDHVANTWLVPGDQDIDGDGVDNIIDSDPFDGRIPQVQERFPPHLFFGPLGISGGGKIEVKESQLQLFKSTGLIAVNARSWHSPRNLRTLEEVWLLIKRFAAPDKFKELRYVIADDDIASRGMTAYYSKDLRALIVASPKESGLSRLQELELQRQVLQTMAHEIGHAFAFSSLTPRDLAEVSSRMGPWQRLKNNSFTSFFSPDFFKRHWLSSATEMSLREFKNIPSRYSLQNIHEWFAESFSSTISSLANESDSDSQQLRPATPAFRLWLMKKFRETSH